MLRNTLVNLKKGWTYHPGTTNRGGKNTAWRPKMSEKRLNNFSALYCETPSRRPNVWHELEFNRLGMTEWPKAVGFFNAGDNFELTPDMMYRLFSKNHEASFWSPQHNEKTIIHLLPLVEKNPQETMKKIHEIFQSHIKKFGADHYIYNAVMQAYAFAKDHEKAKALFDEMKMIGLDPNAQSFVNMMLASKLAGHPREKVEEWFTEAVKENAFVPVMRLDTEFQMWWDQLERLGSFTSSSGFLSNTNEGASPRPRDMWATWGWDRTYERKFVSRNSYIRHEISRRTVSGHTICGTVYTDVKRRPWSKYKGLFPYDWSGPRADRNKTMLGEPPAPEFNKQKVANSY